MKYLIVFVAFCVLSVSGQQQKVLSAAENLQQGSCGNPVNFGDSNKVFVALGVEEFGGEFKTPQCGKCIKIKGPDGEVTGEVASKCGKRCVPGTIQINESAAKKINAKGPGQDGTFDVKWEFVACPGGAGGDKGAAPGAKKEEPKAPQGNQKVIAATEKLDSGSCGKPVDFSGQEPIAALGVEDFGGEFKTPQCEKCVNVKGADGEVKAKIVSKCGKRCVPGTIQLNEAAARKVQKAPAGPDGTFPVTWEIVAC